jgi:hypothetical protein
MKQYIDKAKVVAEIEKWRDGIRKGIFSIPLTGSDKTFATFEYEILEKIIDFIDSFEVKEIDYNDTFIEKAWGWIENNILSSNQQDKSRLYFEQFKNYIEGGEE